MKIGIDARFLTHPQAGGFKTYTENLVKALSMVDSTNDYVLYLDRSPADATLPSQDNFAYRVVKSTVPVLGMSVREQIRLPEVVAQDRVEVMHFPCQTAALRIQCPFVVTLHDTLWLTSRPGSLFSREGRSPKRLAMWLYNRWIPQLAARRARHIITGSQAARVDIVSRLGVAADEISVIHNTIKAIFRPYEGEDLSQVIRRQYGWGKGFILGIGSADPRKNMVGLVSAYAKLPYEIRCRYQLCIVWTHSLLQQELLKLTDQLGVADQVTFLKDVSDEDLALLYNGATLFAFSSHHEGFGLPPLEAMACGTPVVAADNSSIPEVVGDAGLLVDSTDFAALAAAMKRVLGDDALRVHLSQKGLKRAGEFSWRRFGKDVLSVYEGVLG